MFEPGENNRNSREPAFFRARGQGVSRFCGGLGVSGARGGPQVVHTAPARPRSVADSRHARKYVIQPAVFTALFRGDPDSIGLLRPLVGAADPDLSTLGSAGTGGGDQGVGPRAHAPFGGRGLVIEPEQMQ